MSTAMKTGAGNHSMNQRLEQPRHRTITMESQQTLATAFKLALLAAAAACCALPHAARAAGHTKAAAQSAPDNAPPAAPTLVTIDVGMQQLLRQPGPIRRVALADPTIADVSVINSRELLLNGKSTGVTSLLVWGRDSKAAPLSYRIEVAARSIGGSTADLLSHRDAILAAGGGASSKGASGDAGGAQSVADHTTVAVNTQVLTQVKVVDINRTALQEFGFNFFAANHNNVIGGIGTQGGVGSVGSGGSSASGGIGNSVNQITSGTGFIPIANAFNLVYAGNNYLGALSVLESKGLARTLAEPSLTAMSGQTASFLAGGEFPFPTVQNGGGSGNNSVTIIFKEFGIRLNLTPTVLARDRIALKVAPEVSELDYTNGISISGITVPGLNVRRTDTTVELGDGETFVLSGLVSNTLKNAVGKVPWLGDVPVLGAFFRNTSISRNERELIMVVTPHLVKPMNKDAPLPELPGASLDQYNPSFAHTMFMETGKFGQADTGYSR